jgi:hypothetical protein
MEEQKHISIYCDESCHLEHDHQKVMLLGCVWVPNSHIEGIKRDIAALKEKHRAQGELKWGKVSPSREAFFREVITYFFAEDALHFRCVVVQDKSVLDHDQYNDGSHDEFYYKMYFSLLRNILDPSSCHHIYLDIKDTRSRLKVKKLAEILCTDRYDFTGQMISSIQQIRSHEVSLVQLTDLLLGAVSYLHRGLKTSETKNRLVEHLKALSRRSLTTSTPLSERKFNVFVWHPRVADK